MGVRGVGSLVLFTARLRECRAFYRALGLALADEQHEGGPPHCACDVGGAHVALYEAPGGEAPGKGAGGASMLGFTVDDVDAVFARLRALDAPIVWEPRDMPWGRTLQVLDPDGRPVEAFQPAGSS